MVAACKQGHVKGLRLQARLATKRVRSCAEETNHKGQAPCKSRPTRTVVSHQLSM